MKRTKIKEKEAGDGPFKMTFIWIEFTYYETIYLIEQEKYYLIAQEKYFDQDKVLTDQSKLN